MISHAETPASASALPSDSTPSAMAASRRGSRGRSRLAIAWAVWRRPAAPGFAALAIAGQARPAWSDRGITRPAARRPPRRPGHRWPTTGSRWPTTTTVAPARARSTMARSTRCSVPASRCAVGSSSSSTGARRPERPGEAESLPLSQRQTDAVATQARCSPRRAARPAPRRNRKPGRPFRSLRGHRTGSGCRPRCRRRARVVAAARPAAATTLSAPARRRRSRPR